MNACKVDLGVVSNALSRPPTGSQPVLVLAVLPVDLLCVSHFIVFPQCHTTKDTICVTAVTICWLRQNLKGYSKLIYKHIFKWLKH